MLVLRGSYSECGDRSGTYLDVLLQILGPLKGLSAEIAFVRLQRNVDSDVRGNVIALDGGSATGIPATGKVEVVGAFAAHMLFANVLLQEENYQQTISKNNDDHRRPSPFHHRQTMRSCQEHNRIKIGGWAGWAGWALKTSPRVRLLTYKKSLSRSALL